MSRANNTLIETEALNVALAGVDVLQNISVTVDKNDFVTIVGPNGAGKSMLLKCLMGFYRPDSGHIWRRPELRIGYVPQKLFPDYAMPITTKRFLGLRKRANESTLLKIAEETGVTSILGSPLHALSGGELQRALITRALLDDPELLVLDEPAQNLDISGQLRFYQLLEQIYRERELAILMVSHDLHMVMASTKRVICLFHRVCCSGTPHTVTQDPEFTSLFGEDMAKMLSVYRHAHHETTKTSP